jgi:hypothetical protein
MRKQTFEGRFVVALGGSKWFPICERGWVSVSFAFRLRAGCWTIKRLPAGTRGDRNLYHIVWEHFHESWRWTEAHIKRGDVKAQERLCASTVHFLILILHDVLGQ